MYPNIRIKQGEYIINSNACIRTPDISVPSCKYSDSAPRGGFWEFRCGQSEERYWHLVSKTALRQKNRYFKSNQIKSLLLSHHHSTSALVSEILMSVLQTVQKNNRQFTYGQTVQKNSKQFTYGQTVQKKQQTIYIWTDSAKKLHWSIDSAKKTATAVFFNT